MLQSSSLHSFCPSLLLFFFLDASGHRILFVSSSAICFRVRSPCCLKLVSVLLYLLLFFSLGTFGTQSSPCFPPVSVLVSLVGSYSLPEFSFSGCLMAADSSCLSFVSMLSCLPPCLFYYPPRAQCSSFGCFGYRTLLVSHLFPRPSLCLFPTCFDTSLFIAVVLSGCFRRTGCSLSLVCFRTCRPCCLHFVPFFLSVFLFFFLSFFFLSFSLSLSLSLAVLLSRCLLGPLILLVCHLFPYVSSLFSPSRILVSLVLSKLYPSFPPHCYSSLRLLWAECFSLLVFLRISLLACLCVLWDETYYPLHSLTFGYYHMLPYLPSYLFPTYLLIISPLPSFFPGLQHVARRARFLSSSLSFLTCSSILSQCFLHPHYSCYLWVLLGPKILLASHVFQFVSLFSQFFSLFLLHFTFLLILLSPLLFLSRL